MRVGIVGLGRIGSCHAEVVATHPAVGELVVADADADRARALADKLGARALRVPEDLFGAGLDALVIAAPTAAHAELIRRGVRAGVPVFCEKPVALDVASTLDVRDEVERAGAYVQIGFQRRFDAGYTAAREALRAGEIGDLHRVHLVTADQAPPPADYLPASGGLFRDCHVHDFDALRWVTGREAVEVYALGSNRGADYFRSAGDIDNSAAVLRLDDDTLATLQGSRYNGAGHDIRMELAGTRATWVVGLSDRSPVRSAEPGTDFPAGPAWPHYWERFTPAYAAELRAFLATVQQGGPSPCTVADALEAFYVAEAADRSLQEGRPVRVAEVRA